MTRYYDVTVKGKENRGSISYWADSFSITSDGILKIESRECGDIVVSVAFDEEISVHSVDVKDEFDDLLMERGDKNE